LFNDEKKLKLNI